MYALDETSKLHYYDKKNDVYWVKYGSTITKHINNILKSGELETDTVGKIDVDNFKNCKDI